MSDLYMPNTDLQYKDDLRKQRDDWQEIIEYLDNNDPEKAKKKAEKILKRIHESLEDQYADSQITMPVMQNIFLSMYDKKKDVAGYGEDFCHEESGK